jgi:hypothetical protein
MADSKKPFIITNFRAVDMPNAKKVDAPAAKTTSPASKASTAKKKGAQKGLETLSPEPEANSTGKE